MSLYISSINSGSNGNCYYIGNEQEAVLVDAGISCRETEKRMKRLGLSMNSVKAIFVSHEHSDHISGITVLSKKYKLPVYITDNTYRNSGLQLENYLLKSFTAYQTVQVGGFTIIPFPKHHDAADPHSFLVHYDDIKIGVFTDIGAPCDHVIKHFSQCHAAFLEANYDEELLEQGKYPYYLKRRIRGGKGHLSNTQALEIFKSCKPAFMSHLLLSHLSKDNNCPNLVENLFRHHAGDTEIIIASRFKETAVYRVGNVSKHNLYSAATSAYFQTSLF
ncbi:MBL fold metallo-hydrolase [Rubrolithibacter danxiaensis]|uniref:MBL fold metallo-hydrolase n=1 Tax=Rubrolithibacter danxiaensis TaxID=3390805 RepID=UPI003BF8CFEE